MVHWYCVHVPESLSVWDGAKEKDTFLVVVDGRVRVEYRVWFHRSCTGDPWAAKIALQLG